MRNIASETIRTTALFVIAAFPTLALIASYPSHAGTHGVATPAPSSVAAAVASLPLAAAPAGEAAAGQERASTGNDGSRRERRCEQTRRIGKVTHTRCE